MPAGTLTLTNGSDVIPGTGTTFSAELVAGDFVVVTVGGITYTLPVKTVDSDTQITLISRYPGPTQANSAWNAVPRATQNQVTAALVAQTTEALRGLNYDKQNWQAIFSNSGDITVILPDGSSFSGPSWLKITGLLAAIDVDNLELVAAQVHADSLQVAADRTDVDAKAAQASTDAQTASGAASTATAANTAAQQAKADAVAAKTAAETARDAAQSANPDNQLKKVNNLSDVQSASSSRKNIGAVGSSDMTAFIRGLNTLCTASNVTVDVGAFALPDGTIQQVISPITINYSTLAASTWYHLYLYNNAGTIALELSTTAPVAYAYPAHQKTGDATRRYIGSMRTNASGIVSSSRAVNGHCRYIEGYNAQPVVSGGKSTAEVAIAINNSCPPVVSTHVYVDAYNASTDQAMFIYSTPGGGGAYVIRPPQEIYIDMAILSYPYIYYAFNATTVTSGFYSSVMGYSYAR